MSFTPREVHPNHKGKIIVCPECEIILRGKGEAKQHLIDRHAWLKDNCLWLYFFCFCKICKHYTIQKANLKQHMLIMHGSKVLEPDYAGFAGNDFVLGPNGHLSWRLPEQASRLVRLYTEETHSSIRLPNADVDHCSYYLPLPNTPITREPGRNCDTTAQLLSKPGNAAERAYFNADHAYGVNPELYGLCSTYETESLYFDVHAYPPTAKAQVTTSSFTPTSSQHANVPPAEMMPVIRHEVPGSSFSSNVYLENVQDSFIGAAPVVDPIIPNQHTQWEEQFILDNDVHMIADVSEDANAESDFHMLYQTFMNHQVIEEKWIA